MSLKNMKICLIQIQLFSVNELTKNTELSIANVRIDTAVKPQWLNDYGILTATSPINSVYKVKIPAGTKIYYGPVGSQGGVYLGGSDKIQIFVEQPWKNPFVEVIKELPLK